MCRWTGSATGSLPSTASGSRRATSSHRMAGPPGVEAVVEEVAEPFAGPVEADFGGRDGDAGLVGDGLVGESVDVFQHDDLPQGVGEALEGLGELFEPGGGVGDRLG